MITIEKYNDQGEFEDEVKINIFGECERVIDYLRVQRVCDILYNEDRKKFWIGEMCDQYFGADLSVQDCRDLAELFTKMADRIEKDEL